MRHGVYREPGLTAANRRKWRLIGLSRERVSQLSKTALAKLGKAYLFGATRSIVIL